MKTQTKRNAGGSGLWFGVIVFGLFGQIAWVIENMYLNVYLYKTITFDLTATSAMVAASAIVATLTTLFMGVLSDKIGKRKLFMSLGYIVWGLTVMAFAAISVKNAEAMFPGANAVVAATVSIVVMDCVMTFFGSTANDAAFNSWVTDNTTNRNRGRVEGVLQIMPLLAMLVVFGALDGLTQAGNWTLFFVIVGAATTVAGVGGLFFVRDSKTLKKKDGAYFKNIFYGFRPSTVKKNGILYVIFLAMCLIQIGNNIFIPYLMIYLEYFLGFSDYVLLLGGVILGASAVSVVFGIFADKIDKRLLFLPAFLLYIGGGLGMVFARITVAVGFSGFALMAGNLSLLVLLSSLVRIHTPEKTVGLFQGIRMVFTVLVPMCIGPFIGAFVSSTSNSVFVDPTTGAAQPVPSNYIFLAAAIVTATAILPVLFMTLYKKGFLWKKGVTPAADAENRAEEIRERAEENALSEEVSKIVPAEPAEAGASEKKSEAQTDTQSAESGTSEKKTEAKTDPAQSTESETTEKKTEAQTDPAQSRESETSESEEEAQSAESKTVDAQTNISDVETVDAQTNASNAAETIDAQTNVSNMETGNAKTNDFNAAETVDEKTGASDASEAETEQSSAAQSPADAERSEKQ